MTTLAGDKIRKHREAEGLTRAAFGALFGVPGSTIQGWEEEEKRPGKSIIVNQLAAQGIASHADWYLPVCCPRCHAHAEDQEVRKCREAHCPLGVRRVA